MNLTDAERKKVEKILGKERTSELVENSNQSKAVGFINTRKIKTVDDNGNETIREQEELKLAIQPDQLGKQNSEGFYEIVGKFVRNNGEGWHIKMPYLKSREQMNEELREKGIKFQYNSWMNNNKTTTNTEVEVDQSELPY
mgnify:CR=1 FL=1|tara:strand:- start:383 stop:805 length:423 start_codon:yes stop_codon:yes gene_type:complete